MSWSTKIGTLGLAIVLGGAAFGCEGVVEVVDQAGPSSARADLEAASSDAGAIVLFAVTPEASPQLSESAALLRDFGPREAGAREIVVWTTRLLEARICNSLTGETDGACAASAQEFDASVMDQHSGFGAIGLSRGVRSPILSAMAVADLRVMPLVGSGANALDGAVEGPMDASVRRALAKQGQAIPAKAPFGVLARDGDGHFAATVHSGGSLRLPMATLAAMTVQGAGLFVGEAGAVVVVGEDRETVSAQLARTVYEGMFAGADAKASVTEAIRTRFGEGRGFDGIVCAVSKSTAYLHAPQPVSSEVYALEDRKPVTVR